MKIAKLEQHLFFRLAQAHPNKIRICSKHFLDILAVSLHDGGVTFTLHT